MKLVVVESPAKAKTIEKYLGTGYQVLASYGHVRDLPAKDGSVDPDNGFSMIWSNYADKAHRLKAIEDAAKTADSLILATDPDREGEAISWHVLELLKAHDLLPPHVERVTFNAITKPAVTEAMAHPRELDTDLINAYLARRALDYLVGFTLSPVLWRKLPGAKSAGRVQSVALRLVVDREQEIESFKPQEYWSVEAAMEADNIAFTTRLIHWRGHKLDKLSISTKEEAEAAKADVEAGQFTVSKVETKPFSRNPQPPFTTSTLQQEAARKLGFAASHTMRLAQNLYEEGLITYMRTDGVQMDGDAITEARKAITHRYEPSYVPDKPRQYQVKAKNAQEAHEAIRPTDFSRDQAATGDQAKLYQLIWIRAMASQMASAKLERTTIDLADQTGQHMLRVTGQVVLFPGFLALYEEGRDESQNTASDRGDEKQESKDNKIRLPLLREGDSPDKKAVSADQHFTQPPPRYSEASLVKKMEELGIGRPSTYASVLQVLKDRSYVTVERNHFIPSEGGRLVTAFLERFFLRYVSYDFTAGLEESLDDISGGRANWQKVLEAFWHDFKPKTSEVMEQKPSEVTAALDEFLGPWLFPDKGDGHDPRECPICHTGRLALRGGRFGAFIACSNYPECKYTRGFGQGEDDDKDDNEPVVLGWMPVTDESGESADSEKNLSPATTENLSSETASSEKGLPWDASSEDADSAKTAIENKPSEDDEKKAREISRRKGRFGPYIQLGEGKEAKRVSIPKDVNPKEVDLALALKLLALPREVGLHPESGKMIIAGTGRYGPYLNCDGQYARLSSTEELLGTDINSAVVKLAEAAENKGRSRGTRTREPLKVLGNSPVTEKPVQIMDGRYGPYVNDGETNASLPKDSDPESLTLEDALALLEARAKMPKKTKAKKTATKKTTAKKTAAKKTTTKKAETKTPVKKATAKKATTKKSTAVKASPKKASAKTVDTSEAS
ncbi:MAG: type I DNA topoisomerase [Zymomonas mobilis subsp. pomaceae]|uniref:DNA topoisomerase 1 n=1 Tax=Zymomonas mobilis subsp. pomaceae (strain ATCC 29192 / DSM 22645 / JCM 10191 / CCUG 17912 / NBRC 13757 / NCIMB 11200 / NRRL B-4491 / Barker I) TaxID=579138 RepID=F8ETK2_ZYMMT|nr:type I DNA topoisomerase [Zymomonas mobilis]AEI37012.1 DNA topoisomerase I [Zymomonas mobilis subsp. pomaceae ATCC 29192]MDX5948384.1 type I DNA topoisomerase [Zymomonas mobilis subsp. pomaceae]GEB89626.1 DNA topoisomerase 1 [Zymomonas mobilis subsp. pomaceae]